jgi:hypothetical protein
MLVWVAGIAGAASVDSVETLPAQLVSFESWEQRTAAVEELLGRTTDPVDRARVGAALEVVELLELREPNAPRARVRALVAGAIDKRPLQRAEAAKAAAVGADLPEISPTDAWYAKVPLLSPSDAVTLTFAPPILSGEWSATPDTVQAHLTERARAVGWPIGEPGVFEVRAELTEVYGARWAGRIGYGADVHWDVRRDGESVFDVVTRAFHQGPLRPESPDTLLGIALYELLAQEGLVEAVTGGSGTSLADPELERLDVHRMCAYRTVHPDARPLTLDIGGMLVPIDVATFGCAELPVGTRITAPMGTGTVVMGDTDLVIRVDDVEVPGQTVLSATDSAAFDKLRAKGKITEVTILPR